jgi:seryl-tRNA synthetase
MLDIRALRQDGEAIKAALSKRGFDLDLDAFAALDARRKQADVRSQDLQAERKKASKQVGQLIQSGMDVEQAKAQVAESLKTIDQELDQEVANAKAIQEEIRDFLMGIPNAPQDAVPAGNDEDDNVEVRQWGTPKTFAFEAGRSRFRARRQTLRQPLCGNDRWPGPSAPCADRFYARHSQQRTWL